jgi:hypothetical protein
MPSLQRGGLFSHDDFSGERDARVVFMGSFNRMLCRPLARHAGATDSHRLSCTPA